METIKMGPAGLRNAVNKTEWDDKGHNIISHIIVSHDTSGVRSIQFGYVNDGAVAKSKVYGASSVACSSQIVRLKHESEFVTGLSLEIYSGYITSLTFHTNQRKHEVVRLKFESNYGVGPQKIELQPGILERCEFEGFFGAYNSVSLVSIGFYVRLVLPGGKKIKNEKV